MSLRIVIDTNVCVSRFLRPQSVPGLAVAKAWMEACPLMSTLTWNELHAVLLRPKFARYIQPGSIEPFLQQVWTASEEIVTGKPIRACRDPRDDKFLEVAVYGKADVLLTGDADLLALHPFRGVAILSPVAFLGDK
jgi:putative PIN family toxin of toxin-antitoxin system